MKNIRGVNMRSFTVVFLSVFLALSSGCAKDTKETESEIIKFDPSFSEKIEKRDSLRQKISEINSEFDANKAKIQEQILLLRSKEKELSARNAQEIENLKQQIEPERRQIQREIIELKSQYDVILSSLAGINKDIREISKLVEKKDDLSLSQEELSTWNDRLSTLMKRRTLKESERIELRRKIMITKMKLNVMKL